MTQVQEIAKPLPITPIHLANVYVIGLINLRGQIATAIGLRELFDLEQEKQRKKRCQSCVKCDGALLSLLVDRIGDVIEVSDDQFEITPETVSQSTRKFMRGIYKTSEAILSVIEVNQISQYLNQQNKASY